MKVTSYFMDGGYLSWPNNLKTWSQLGIYYLELRFPSSFTSNERRHIHSLATGRGLKSKSQGKGVNRFLTLYKRWFEGSILNHYLLFIYLLNREYNVFSNRKSSGKDAVGTEISLSSSSIQVLADFISEHPLTSTERYELVPISDKAAPSHGSASSNSFSKKTIACSIKSNYFFWTFFRSQPVTQHGET